MQDVEDIIQERSSDESAQAAFAAHRKKLREGEANSLPPNFEEWKEGERCKSNLSFPFILDRKAKQATELKTGNETLSLSE